MAEEDQMKTFAFWTHFIGRDWLRSRFPWAVTTGINEPLDYTTVTPSLGHSDGAIMEWIHARFGREAVGCIPPLFPPS